MEEVDKTSLLLAAHLYADEDFREIDSFCTALAERDLVKDYQRASKPSKTSTRIQAPPSASRRKARWSSFCKVIDCFDVKNWDRPTTEAEKIIDEYAQEALNPVQDHVANRILDIMYERIMERSQSSR